MTDNLVLITGANGHIGFKVVVLALQAGYRVRAVVRAHAKATQILESTSIKSLDPGDRLTFTFVPDLLVSGAYDDALKGVDYAIHIASPITSGMSEDKYQSHLIEPAITGTMNFLEAAEKVQNLKRVVITSSIVAVISWNDFFVQETNKVFDERSRIPNPTGPYGSEFEAYSASKTFALNLAEKWMAEHKPRFSLVHVHPAFVLGSDELVTQLDDMTRGTNGTALRQVLGVNSPYPLPGSTIHLDDTALAHVKALNDDIPNGQSLLTSSEGIRGTVWGEALSVVEKHFPEAVKNAILPNNGIIKTKSVKIDSTESQKLLGYSFKTYEEQIVNIVEHYLRLAGVPAI